MEIDRVELEDVGDNPKRLAAALIEQSGITSGSVPIRELAVASGIFEIREENLTSFEGALVTTATKDRGSIIVKSDRPEKRKRFTIGHELGHFLIGYHRPKGARFECSSRDMSVSNFKSTNDAAKMEVEANQFAAEVLMPIKIMKPWMSRRREIDIAHLVDLSEQFDVSKEAAARRFLALANEPIAFIFSKAGSIKYCLRHEDFPHLDVRSGDPIPLDSITNRFNRAVGTASGLDLVDQGIWLLNSRKGHVCEQVLIQRNEYRLTLLALPIEDDDDEPEWDAPRFRR